MVSTPAPAPCAATVCATLSTTAGIPRTLVPPVPSVSPPPAPAAGNTTPTTSGSTVCTGCPSGPPRTARSSRRPPPPPRLLLHPQPRLPDQASSECHTACPVTSTHSPPFQPTRLITSHDPDGPAPSLQPPLQGPSHYYGRSASAPRDGTLLLAVSPLGVLPLAAAPTGRGITAHAFPCFAHRAPDRDHATYMPDTAWAVNGYPPDLSRGTWWTPVLMPSYAFDTSAVGHSHSLIFPVHT